MKEIKNEFKCTPSSYKKLFCNPRPTNAPYPVPLQEAKRGFTLYCRLIVDLITAYRKEHHPPRWELDNVAVGRSKITAAKYASKRARGPLMDLHDQLAIIIGWRMTFSISSQRTANGRRIVDCQLKK